MEADGRARGCEAPSQVLLLAQRYERQERVMLDVDARTIHKI